MKKIKKRFDSVLMKRTIQKQLSKEMKNMTVAARLEYIKRQVGYCLIILADRIYRFSRIKSTRLSSGKTGTLIIS